MRPLKSIFSVKMQEADPTLDVLKSDCRMFQIAFKDFVNYVRFNWKLDGETSDYEIVEKIERFFEKNPAELELSLTVWIGIWIRKWKERVKLLIGNPENNELIQGSKALVKADVSWKKLESKEEMIELVASALIKNAEICGTQILAEHILKLELGKMDKFDADSKEQLFAILSNALRRVHDMTKNIGPLFFLKVDKAYYANQIS